MEEPDDNQIHEGSAPDDESPTIRMPLRVPFVGSPPWPPLQSPGSTPTEPTEPSEPYATGGQLWHVVPRKKRKNRRRAAIVGMGVLVLLAATTGTLLAFGEIGNGSLGLVGRAGSVVERATATPLPTPTATLVPLPDFSLPSFCNVPSGTAASPDCVQCPYTYDGTQYSRAQIEAALNAAADQYNLPRALVYAVAWGESNWHSGFITCNYDLGVMQLKQGYLASFDNLNEPPGWCPGVQRTLYDPIRSMQQNVLLGAKWLAWLRCYYGWMASGGGSQATPDRDTLAWYYKQAATPLPDTAVAGSLCASTAQDSSKPWIKDLGAEATDLWSCPFSAKAGDRTFLDIVLAAYNGGPQAMDGSIPNDYYVSYIEGIMTQFAQGQLPA